MNVLLVIVAVLREKELYQLYTARFEASSLWLCYTYGLLPRKQDS